MSTPLARAEEAMNKAQKKLEEAEARFTTWKTTNPGYSRTNEDYLELKEEYDKAYDNLKRKEESYNLLLRQLPQQGIGMEANGRRKSKCWLGKSYCTVRRDF
jgi:DNA repair ATPase RecN